MKEFLKRRLVRPILDLLKQGVTPEKIALSVAIGAAIGVFPAIGTTTTICAVLAFALGLNLPAIQLVNYLMYPAQIALLLPFFRFGEKLFRAPHVPISAAQIHAMVHESPWNTIKFLWTATWHAMVAWCLIAPVLVAALYATLTPLLRHAMTREGSSTTTSASQSQRMSSTSS
jgi:uncharacterized protein (DUF2062 family)